MSASKLGRARCPRCGGTYCITRRQRLRMHRNPNRSDGAPWECPQTPDPQPDEVEP